MLNSNNDFDVEETQIVGGFQASSSSNFSYDQHMTEFVDNLRMKIKFIQLINSGQIQLRGDIISQMNELGFPESLLRVRISDLNVDEMKKKIREIETFIEYSKRKTNIENLEMILMNQSTYCSIIPHDLIGLIRDQL